MSESFSTLPLQTQIPAFLYQEFFDDENVQSFVDAYNMLAQQYLNWFNQTPLSVYTSAAISDSLLDWIGNGIYGIARPVLSTFSSQIIAGYGTGFYGGPPAYGELQYSGSGTAMIAADDVYKRVLTWHTYKGDGIQFNLQWLKNRVTRFLYGINGTDYPVLNAPASVTLSGSTFAIGLQNNANSFLFQECLNNGILALPFQYIFQVNIADSNFSSDFTTDFA